SIKHTPEERKRLYNNYKSNALYLTIDYIDLAYFLSFLILYKGVEGLNNNTKKLEEYFNIFEMEIWQYRDNYNNYSYSNFFTETFNSIAKDDSPLLETYISSFCYLAYKFQGFLPDSGAAGKFKISLKDNYKFNYLIIIDIIYIDSNPILYIINSAIIYSVSGFLKNMIAKYI
ncbi:hypothetical protein BUE80_DR001968, partial [Diplocarpon rosae]